MRDKLYYYFANIALITAMPCVLAFALIGVDMMFDMRSFYGFIFMTISGFYIAFCGCLTAVQIKKTFVV